jgi:hypothetical protein
VVRVELDDPLVLSCAACGWLPSGQPAIGPLLRRVLDHWLVEHWDRAGLDDGGEYKR